MAIDVKPSKGYHAEPGKPSFFILIYRGPYRWFGSPAKPDQILQADTWKEAQIFAAVFAGATVHQYVVISSLTRLPTGSGLEVAREDYWRENDKLYRKPWRLGKETIADLSEVVYPEPIAQEKEGGFGERIRRAKEMMKRARPGETLVDVVRRQTEAEFAARAKQSTEELFKYGDRRPEQTRLIPEPPPSVADWMEWIDSELSNAEGASMSLILLRKRAIEIFPKLEPNQRLDGIEAAVKQLVARRIVKLTKPPSGERLVRLRPGSLDEFALETEGGRKDPREYLTTLTEWFADMKLPYLVYQSDDDRFFILENFDTNEKRQFRTIPELRSFVENLGPQAHEEGPAGEDASWSITEIEAAQLACAIDTEGWISIGKRKDRPSAGDPSIGVVNTSKQWIQGLHRLVPFMSLSVAKQAPTAFGKLPIFRLSTSKQSDILRVLNRIKQYLVIKKDNADKMIQWITIGHRTSEQYKASEENIEKLRRISRSGVEARLRKKEEVGTEAFENDPSGWDKPLSSSQGAFTFRGWVLRNKLADVGTTELEYAVDQIIKAHPDQTANEARSEVESVHSTPPSPEETATPQIGEWFEIATAIDWERISGKEQMGALAKTRVDEIKKELQELREAGAITKDEESRLLGVSVERLTSKQKESFLARIAELEKQLDQLKKPPPTPEEAARQRRVAERRDHDGVRGPIPQEQVDLLFNTFNSIITRRTKREPLPTEIAKFDELIATMQRIQPALKFVQARIQIENLARQIAAVATAGKIVLRRGQARIDELLDLMLSRRLTEDEEDELRRLREGEELTSLEVIEYEPPTLLLIADSGPTKNPIGTPVEAAQPDQYPRVVMRTWERANAEENRERLEKIGYKIRIEGEEPPSEI